MTTKPEICREPLSEEEAVAQARAFERHVLDCVGVSYAKMGEKNVLLYPNVDQLMGVVTCLHDALAHALAGYPLPEYKPLEPKTARTPKKARRA